MCPRAKLQCVAENDLELLSDPVSTYSVGDHTQGFVSVNGQCSK